MRAQQSKPTSQGLTLAGIIVLVAIVGFLAAIIVPQFTGVHEGDPPSILQSQLQTIRSYMELYNTENPRTPYDASTPVGPAFWDPLVQNNYLQMAPKNPLQDNSSLVVASPMEGAGWVWAESRLPLGPEFAGTYIIWAIDEDGKLYDGDKDGMPD